MGRLLVFTENYNVPAGGASYIVDLCNAVGSSYEEIVFASNANTAFAPDTQARVEHPSRALDVPLWTAVRLGVHLAALPERSLRRRFGGVLRRLMERHDRLVFAYNKAVCRRLIRQTNPSAILAFNGGYPAGRAVLAMVPVARQAGVPVALTAVSVPFPRPEGRLGEWERRMDWIVHESAHVVIVNAQTIGDSLTATRGFPGDKIRVVHNALADVDLPDVEEHGDVIRVGCVSRMDHLKGTHFLVSAFARLAEAYPNTELVLVGDGPSRPSVEQLVHDLGLDSRVTMTGHYPGDTTPLVASFDIYAFPSLWEGLPYAILEAMRLGRAIVATEVGGVPEAISDGDTGLLVPPSSADDLADAIRRLIGHPELRVRLGVAARARYESEFSQQAMYRAACAVFAEAGLLAGE